MVTGFLSRTTRLIWINWGELFWSLAAVAVWGLLVLVVEGRVTLIWYVVCSVMLWHHPDRSRRRNKLRKISMFTITVVYHVPYNNSICQA